MNLIAAVDSNWAIGNKGKLLISIPSDMKYFRQMTEGKTVVMGRKTLESFPGKRPLKNRTNIVLTRNASFHADGAVTVTSLDELFGELKKYSDGDIFVIGGETVYKELLSYCDTAYVTKIERTYEADAYFPNLDTNTEWALAREGSEQTYFDATYKFTVYERRRGA